MSWNANTSRWAFVIILVLFLTLATLYNAIIPVYESPDELQHAAFVAWLADGRGVPVVNAEKPGPWEQEGTQPPLYYWLAASVASRVRYGDVGSLARLNPNASIGDPQRPDNKNRVLHDLEAERWPYRDATLFVHLARSVSTLMAAGSVLAIYFLGRIVFPDRPGIALGMAGLTAFMPQFLFLSASINNDNLVILIASWVLVLLASWLSTSRLPGWLSVAGLGALLGLGALAKFSGLLLWPLAAGTMLWLAWEHKRLRWLIPAGLLVAGVALAVSGWWFLRNYQLYGDLSGVVTHLQIIGTRRRFPTRVGALLAELRGLRYSFWALFGWFNILLPDPFYWLLDTASVLGIVGFVVFAARSLRHYPRWTWHILVLLLAWIALVTAALLRWTSLTSASQGRLLYPALPAIVLILVVGWAELVPRRLCRPVGVVALAVWVVWAALCPFLFIRPAYALPERVQTLDALAATPLELGVRYGDCCELAGYIPPDEPVNPGDRVPLTLVWKALGTVKEDYSLFVHATAADGQLVGQLDTYHGGGMYPTGQWRPGEIIADTAYVPIKWKAKGPMLVRFNVGLYERSTTEQLPAYAPDGQELDVVWAGEVALEPFQWPQLPSGSPPMAVFDGSIELAGVDPSPPAVRPGEVLTVTLHWRSLDRITEDYTGFVHLVDPAGKDVAQDDHAPLNGQYPTRLWSDKTVLSDPYRLELPNDLEGGTYELWGGLYRSGSGQRLMAVSPSSGERWKDDLVDLGTVVVVGTQ